MISYANYKGKTSKRLVYKQYFLLFYVHCWKSWNCWKSKKMKLLAQN